MINKHLISEQLSWWGRTRHTMYTDGYVKLYLAREVKDNSGACWIIEIDLRGSKSSNLTSKTVVYGYVWCDVFITGTDKHYIIIHLFSIT